MRKFYFFLLSLGICNILYAQNVNTGVHGTFSVTEGEIKWDSPQIASLGDTIFISFNIQDTMVILNTQVNGLTRTRLTDLINTKTSIFHQIGYNYYTDAGKLSGKYDTGKDVAIARVVIKKKDLPITIDFNKDPKETITIYDFDSNSTLFDNLIRKKGVTCQLPELKKDTIPMDFLPNYKFFLPDMTVSNGWKAEPEYKINGNSVTVETDKDKKKYIQFSDDICKNVANGTSLIITSHVTIYKEDKKQAKQYFIHTIDRNVLELYIETGKFDWKTNIVSWLKQPIPWNGIIIIIVLVVIIIVLVVIIITTIKKKSGGNALSDEKDEINKYIQGIIEKKASDEKKDLINRLLENEDENFKNQIVSNPNDKLLEELREANAILAREKGELEGQITQLKTDKVGLETKIKTLTESCEALKSEKEDLRKNNNRLQKENENLQNQVDRQTRTITELRSEVAGLKTMIVDKDRQIVQLFEKIKALKDQLARISRQNMYLLQIDDTLKEVSGGILNAFSEVEEGELKKKLAIPILNGVAGLDVGVTAYYSCWKNQVMLKQKEFLGKDLYEMSDEEVKKKLVSGYLKTLAQGDTFSKLTRLYMYIQVDWINEILIKNKFNVDAIDRIFNRLVLLFNDFGIEINYPRLFIDHMNEKKYTFDPRGEVFKLFPVSEEMRALYSKQTDLIVDVIQVGISIPSEQYNRNAVVSIPNF